MGGVTAGQFCLEDRRCRAGLNLDGIPQYGTMIDKPLQRPFLMVHSGRPGRRGASDAIYERAA
jgi:predicted dienelactone hydrolase